MDLISIVQAHLGLVVFTAISAGLIAYLAYTMVHPDRF
ncbi:MAG TPA: potassium-transporting ATPase subunit F [Thermoplasmata archaeon]|nr:potassium-transporting ATPase subunit F [Thermoplasmata archaeon]